MNNIILDIAAPDILPSIGLGVILGVIAAVVVVALGVVLILVAVSRKKKKMNQNGTETKESAGTEENKEQ